MKTAELTCPHCGAHMTTDTDFKQAKCDYCGCSVLIDNSISRAPAPAPQKRRTVWWVLGWIFIFPLPLTIILARSKKIKTAFKIILIVLAWLLYVVICIATGAGSSKETPDSMAGKGNITALNFADTSDITLIVGDAVTNQKLNVDYKYRSEFKPEYVSFVSANPEIASINYIGNLISKELNYRIEGFAPGETEVWAEAENGAVTTERIRVVVLTPIEVESVLVQPNKCELVIGETIQLSAVIFPENAHNKNLIWISSDESVALVDEGFVKGVGGGNAIIAARSEKGVEGICEVNVDSSKALMNLRVIRKRQDDNNIGEEWIFQTEVNGEKTKNDYLISEGDTVSCYSRISEEDDIPDVGEAKAAYLVTQNDLKTGFEISFNVTVTENAGPNSGKSAIFLVTYLFEPAQ